MGTIKNKPHKVTTTLKIVITGEFYDDEASEETLRYCVEQDLEDAGFNVDVTLLKGICEQLEEVENIVENEVHPVVSPDNWHVYSSLHDELEQLKILLEHNNVI